MPGESNQSTTLIDHNVISNGILENAGEDVKELYNLSIIGTDGLPEVCVSNGGSGSLSRLTNNYDELTAMVFDLSFQNAFLKAQFDGFKHEMFSSMEALNKEKEIGNGVTFEEVNMLQEKIKTLNKEIQEQKETQKAAENALEHLRVSYAEADGKIEELSTKLNEVQQKKEQEIAERDEKYVDLDSKFQRLHKRAKQRIQELQKEKDDLEVRSRDLNEAAEKASAQQSSIQQELERTRQQANEALRAMDTERQLLRTTNNKLRDNIDEMHRLLETKETTLEELRQSIFEKEQILGDTQRLLQAAEERKQTSIAEISSKHQMVVESFEAQLAEALSDRRKSAETLSSLQVLIDEKDSQIAELEAASTGEVVRLGAAIEAAKAEVLQLKHEHEKERDCWNASFQTLKTKLETSESACLRTEIEMAKAKSHFESELSLQNQLLIAKDSNLLAAKEEISRLESEFSSYKVRAHLLLQKKEADLQAAKDIEKINAQEDILREAEKEVAMALAEREKALHDLDSALRKYEEEIASRDAALLKAEQRNRSLALRLDSLNAQHLAEKEAIQKTIGDVEESWRLKYKELEAQNNAQFGNTLESKLRDLKLQYSKLKEEHDTFREIADRMLEEKENKIIKLSEDNKKLLHSLESRPSVNISESLDAASSKQDSTNLNIAAAEQQILLLARQQAQREEELAQSQRHILALQEVIEELERENRLHNQQEAMLKEELRDMERKQKREGVDMTYLKNVILKLLETGEVEVLLPVVAMLLQFSPEEIRKCQQAYRSANDASSSPAASPAESPGLTARSLFSRFAFS